MDGFPRYWFGGPNSIRMPGGQKSKIKIEKDCTLCLKMKVTVIILTKVSLHVSSCIGLSVSRPPVHTGSLPATFFTNILKSENSTSNMCLLMKEKKQ